VPAQVDVVPVERAHVAELLRIRATPEVLARWGDPEPDWPFDDPEIVGHTVLVNGTVRGWIEYSEEPTPMYRHAGIDVFLDPAVHNRGVGRRAVWHIARFLLDSRGHHRLTIDPAADNIPAIRCYASVGFRPVGIMRQYERGPDGSWHDGLLMDLLAGELREP
jgi:aminoglycoside 6'-N-acetyltransferase